MELPPSITPIKKKSNSSYSNCYSITIRTGKGINLGSNPLIRLEEYIIRTFTSYIFTIEMENENAHFQGAIYSVTPIRQDKLREKFLSFVIDMYKEDVGPYITDKGLANVRKILSTPKATKGSTPSAPSGGSSAPAAPSINPASLFPTQQLQGAETEQIGSGGIGQQQQQVIRAVVSERDVTAVQNRISNYESRSEIG